MPLVTLKDLSIRFRGPELLSDVTCRIDQNQRIGLLGRNGAGKSTLMKLISGQLQADTGAVIVEPGVTVRQLAQEVPQSTTGTIVEIVLSSVDSTGVADWEKQNRADQILSRMGLDPDARFEALSSGMKRRVLLAQALADAPDLLLLDEPTNHLDIEAIRWLEEFLLKWKGTVLFVTHDRSFLRRLATRILEIDRGKIFDWSCDYDKFLERKEAILEAEEKQNAEFDKKLAQEEAWIRKGIKARRTRNQGRVRALKQLRIERQQRREKTGVSRIEIHSGKRSGNLIAEVDDISFSYPDHPIVKGFSTEILRGDKIGIIGPNGAGKTTLLRLLLGKLKPDSGKVRNGTNLEIAYFDQLRDRLELDETVKHNVADGYEKISINGREKHVLGYLQDFLFPPERAMTPVKMLSGGEKNRLLLAKLFAKTANVLVLDEPTNDLDSETLDLLEEKLTEFPGTILLVSHDRTFLNNVVTSTIVFENNNVKEYDGGYDDWLRMSQAAGNDDPESSGKTSESNGGRAKKKESSSSRRKLTFKESQELKSLPSRIEKLESEISSLHDVMASPDFYQEGGEQIAKAQGELQELNSQLEEAFFRWESLEEKQNG